jgi:hypothetical protein
MQVKSIRVDDGKPIEMTGQSVEVVGQQFTGEWLLPSITHLERLKNYIPARGPPCFRLR